jgi:uncharacterized protein YndB with AHSA1/START domain
MKIIKKIVFWLVCFIALALLVGLFLPTQFSVKRSAMIAQPNDTVFEYVKLLKNQEQYGIWWKADPKMEKSYSGTDGQPGFVAAWKSEDENVGAGQQKIVAIQEGKRIDFELKFIEPFESTNQAFMATQEIDEQNTRVSWSISGEMPYPGNLMTLFIDMEETLGNDLEKGLKNLKKLLEK